MNPLALKKGFARDLKKFAGKGMAEDMKKRHGLMPPEPEAAVSVEIETAPGLDGQPDGSKPVEECSTEELMAILAERMATEKKDESAPVPELEPTTEVAEVTDESDDEEDNYGTA